MNDLGISLKGIGLFLGLSLFGGGLFFDVETSRATSLDDECSTTQKAQIESGITALEKGRGAEAITHLQKVVEGTPSCRLTEQGSAAYWLGKAYEVQGDTERQLETWRIGLNALEESPDPFDVRLADEYVDLVFRNEYGHEYDRATQAYLSLLDRVGETDQKGEVSRIARHIRLVAEVVPASFWVEASLPTSFDLETIQSLPVSAGDQLVAWWRAQDPLPSTVSNERIEEHLERVAHAREHFAKEGLVDDRGLVYVRLGSPSRQTTIRFSSIEFTKGVLSGDSRFNAAKFKQGKFWVYDHISRATQFLFVEVEKNRFEQGDVLSMLPSSLRRSFSSSNRGREEAEAFVRAMKEAYSQLAVYSDRYHSQHQDLANYVLDFNSNRPKQRPAGNRSAQEIARRTLPRIKEANRYQQQRRKENTPRVFSDEEDETGSLPIAVHYARFLDSEGKTRIDVSWSTASSALISGPENVEKEYLIGTAVLQRGIDGERVAYQYHSGAFNSTQAGGDGFVHPETYQIVTETDQPFRLELQWDQYVAGPSGKPKADSRVGRAVHRSDTLSSLESDPRTLVMSDLQPMVIPNTGQVEEALPYPFDAVTLDSPLALYFEVYNLNFGEEDRTRYTIEYDVYEQSGPSEREQGEPSRIRQGTGVATTNEGRSQTAEEYIQIDLRDWDFNANTDLTIAVRVTDEVTGVEKLRTIDFEVVSSDVTSRIQ